jgi:hypothetical protein
MGGSAGLARSKTIGAELSLTQIVEHPFTMAFALLGQHLRGSILSAW